MPPPKQRVAGRHPNRLRQTRKALDITQQALSERCGALRDSDPDKYTTVSKHTVGELEKGINRPQQKRARTLAAALGVEEVEALFPLGWDDPNHNPEGKTKINPDRKKGGRPPKS